MSMRKILLAGTAGVFTLGAAAFAASADDGETRSDAAESAAVMAASHSLSDAVRAAEAKTSGQAFSAALEDEDDMMVYEIHTTSGDAVTEVLVSLSSGDVIEGDEDSKMIRDDEDVAALGGAKISLLDAVSAAESSVGGKAMEAELDDQDGSSPASYKVEVASADGAVTKVFIDSAAGGVLKSSPGSDHEDGDDEDHEDDDDNGDEQD